MKFALIALFAVLLCACALALPKGGVNAAYASNTVYSRVAGQRCNGQSPCANGHGRCLDGVCYPADEGLGECGPEAFAPACDDDCETAGGLVHTRALSHAYTHWAAGDVTLPPGPLEGFSSAEVADYMIDFLTDGGGGGAEIDQDILTSAFHQRCPPLTMDDVSDWIIEAPSHPVSPFGNVLRQYLHLQTEFVSAGGAVGSLSPLFHRDGPGDGTNSTRNPIGGCLEGACTYTISGISRRLTRLADRTLCEGDDGENLSQAQEKVNDSLCLSLIDDDWEYKALLTSVFTCRKDDDAVCTFFYRGARLAAIAKPNAV